MKILWIYNMPLVPEAGGTERITSLVAKGLAANGHDCMDILVFRENEQIMTYKGKPVHDLYRFLKDNKVDVVINQIAYAKWLLHDFLDRGGRRWHEEGGKIISCLHFDPCNPSMLYWAKSKVNKTLVDYFIIIKAYLLKHRYDRIKKNNESQIYNYIYEKSDFFVILSDTHSPYLKKVMNRTDYSKLVTINNPLTFDTIATEASLYNKNNVVLVCARMSEYHKRISIVLKVWKRLQNQGAIDGWILKLIGEGPDLDRYKSYVTENKLENVQFCGRQSPLPYYQEASILLLTSSAEGWGLSLTEALQNGVVPIVMNSSPVFADIVTHCFNGYIVPNNNISEFVNYCKDLMSDNRRLRAMQTNAILSSARFSLTNTIELWQKIIN